MMFGMIKGMIMVSEGGRSQNGGNMMRDELRDVQMKRARVRNEGRGPGYHWSTHPKHNWDSISCDWTGAIDTQSNVSPKELTRMTS